MRQNPHVRICGGPGSATTLVYPTAADVYEGRRVAILTRRERIKRRTLLGSHSLLLREGVIPWKGGLERAE